MFDAFVTAFTADPSTIAGFLATAAFAGLSIAGIASAIMSVVRR